MNAARERRLRSPDLDVVGWTGRARPTTAGSGLTLQPRSGSWTARTPALAQGYAKVGPGQWIEVQVTTVGRRRRCGAQLDRCRCDGEPFITAYPADQPLPFATSSLNLDPARHAANSVMMSVRRVGRIPPGQLVGAVDLVADVVGTCEVPLLGEQVAGRVVPFDQPLRIVDTRSGDGATGRTRQRTDTVPDVGSLTAALPGWS